MRARRWDALLRGFGQEALLAHLARSKAEDRASIEAQLDRIDWELLRSWREERDPGWDLAGEVEAHPYVAAGERQREPEAARLGARALREGRVGFVLIAGGQASRLRWDGPKGTFPIGPAGDRTLFQIHAEKIRAAGRRSGTPPRLAVTTSPNSDAAIRSFFAARGHFGLPPERVSFCCQGELPALGLDGSLLLESPGRLFTSPDGHGGAVAALESSGLLAEWERAGIDAVCTFQVDNPLLRLGDEDFLGRLFRGEAPIVTKAVLKRDPGEKVGVVVRMRGRPAIIEYSELPPAMAAERAADGGLRLRLGSIAVHAFRMEFLRSALRERQPWHRARREIPALDASGAVRRTPGLKFERFLFDLFRLAPEVEVVECLREREFAPLKNAEGPDSPATVRAALEAEYRRWHAEAGILPPEGPLEISPLAAVGPEDLVGS
jgi:UDP-N-acetylglucosamine/UDP-N-acetylgalactosamine diphosphorylase